MLQYIPKTARVQIVEEALYNRDHVIQLLKDQYTKSQSRMKQFANRRRTERELVGELVLLKLQPYRRRTIRGSTPQKLAAKYFGPYKVIERIGKVAYRLDLPPTFRIHNVFHVSLLKKFYGSENPSNEEIPYLWEFEDHQSEAIMDRRMVKRKNTDVTQVLAKWKGVNAIEATWEDYAAMAGRLPVEDFAGEVAC